MQDKIDLVGTADSEPDHLKVGVPQDVDYERYNDPHSNPNSNTSNGQILKPLNSSEMSGMDSEKQRLIGSQVSGGCK